MHKPLDRIHFGPVNGFFWFATTLKNTDSRKQDVIFQIRQPHIYQLQFYRVRDDSISLESETGIHLDFFHRPSPHRYFNFPIELPPGETYTLLLKVHHLNSLSLPVYLISHAKSDQDDYVQNLLWGFWLGFLTFCSLLAFIAALLIRKSIFVWYFLYTFSAALYGFTDQGFAFQFIFPRGADLNATVIINLGVCGFIFLIKFSQNLLDTRKYLPRVHTFLNGIFYFIVAMLVAGLLLPGVMFRYSTIVLPVVNFLIIMGLLPLAYSGFKALFTNRIIALFYLGAYLTLVATGIFAVLVYGFGVYQYVGPNPILFAYFFEAILLSIALVILFRQIYQERAALADRVNAQQKEMYQQYIDGIEKERSRIAGELHDDIGSRLSHLKRGIQNSAENATKLLDEIIQDIRILSHDLAPPVAKVSGLIPLVEKLIVDARKSSGIDIKLQLFDYQERLSSQAIQQVFRILQEAVHNIMNHSGATRADIQLFGYEDELVLTIEDDGKGFDTEKAQGLGLTQMKVRTESLGGKIEIDSQPSMGGCHILVQIPYKIIS